MIGLKKLNLLKIWEQKRKKQRKYLPIKERNGKEKIDTKIKNKWEH